MAGRGVGVVKIGRYNSLRQSRWGDPDRRRLSPFAKLAELYLETGPNANMAGIGPPFAR